MQERRRSERRGEAGLERQSWCLLDLKGGGVQCQGAAKGFCSALVAVREVEVNGRKQESGESGLE